jgi:hypothetical protein
MQRIRLTLGRLLAALAVIVAVLVVYYRRHELLPGYATWVRAATVVILVIRLGRPSLAGAAATLAVGGAFTAIVLGLSGDGAIEA